MNDKSTTKEVITALISENYVKLLKVANYLTKNDSTIEGADILHSTFVKMLTKPDSYDSTRPNSSFYTWAATCVKHRYLNYLTEKTQKCRDAVLFSDLALNEGLIPELEDTSLKSEEVEILYELIHKIINELDSSTKAVILNFMDGYTQPEMGENLSLEPNQVRHILQRGFVRVRSMLIEATTLNEKQAILTKNIARFNELPELEYTVLQKYLKNPNITKIGKETGLCWKSVTDVINGLIVEFENGTSNFNITAVSKHIEQENKYILLCQNEELIDKLRTPKRIEFARYIGKGYSYERIAKIMGMKEGAYNSMRFKVLNLLKEFEAERTTQCI